MGASSGAIRAGAAFVELFTNDSKLVQGLDRAEGRVRKFGTMMAKVGAAIGAAGALVRSPLEVARKIAIDDGAEVAKLAKSLGTTAEELTALGYAAAKSGVSFSQLSGYLDGLPATLSNLADGAGEGADLLRRLNIPARDLINMGLEDRMAALADGIKSVVNPIDRARVATDLFGEAGKDMLPFLEQGGAAYRKLAAEAKATGQVMPTEQANRSAQAARALVSAYEAARKVIVEVGAAIIPPAATITKLSDGFQSAAKTVREFVRENKAVVSIIGMVAGGVVAAGTALAALGVVVTAVGTGIGVISSVVGFAIPIVIVTFKLLLAAVLAILSPFGLIAVAVYAAGAALVYYGDVGKETLTGIWGAVKQAVAPIIDYFKAMTATFTAAWAGIKTAIQAGDFQAAFRVLVAALNVEWTRMMVVFTDGWNAFKGVFVDGAYKILTAAKLAWNDLKAAFLTALGGMIAKLEDLWAKSDGFADFLMNVFKAAADFAKDYLGNAFETAAARGKAAFLEMTSSWQNVLKAIGFITFPGAAAALALIDRSKEEIQAALEKAGEKGQQSLEAFQKFRDEQAGRLGAAAGQGNDAIETNRAAEAARIRAEAAKDAAARQADRAGDSNAAQDKFAQAQQEFAAALANALATIAELEKEKDKDKNNGGKDNAGIAAKTLPTLQRGTFSAPSFGQFFSAPGLQNRQLTEAVKTNVKLDEVKKAIQDGSVRPESAAVFK